MQKVQEKQVVCYSCICQCNILAVNVWFYVRHSHGIYIAKADHSEPYSQYTLGMKKL